MPATIAVCADIAKRTLTDWPCICRGVHPVIKADGGEKPTNGALTNGHGPQSNAGDHNQSSSLPTVSPGRLQYSKAAQAAAFAECRAVVSEHDSCAAFHFMHPSLCIGNRGLTVTVMSHTSV